MPAGCASSTLSKRVLSASSTLLFTSSIATASSAIFSMLFNKSIVLSSGGFEELRRDETRFEVAKLIRTVTWELHPRRAHFGLFQLFSVSQPHTVLAPCARAQVG
jgi:hypothetical protein